MARCARPAGTPCPRGMPCIATWSARSAAANAIMAGPPGCSCAWTSWTSCFCAGAERALRSLRELEHLHDDASVLVAEAQGAMGDDVVIFPKCGVTSAADLDPFSVFFADDRVYFLCREDGRCLLASHCSLKRHDLNGETIAVNAGLRIKTGGSRYVARSFTQARAMCRMRGRVFSEWLNHAGLDIRLLALIHLHSL